MPPLTPPTSVTVLINGTLRYPILLHSMKISLQEGLGGCDASVSLVNIDGTYQLVNDDTLEFSLGGVDFKGRISAVEHQSDTSVIIQNVTAAGPQEFLLQEVFPKYERAFGSVSSILTDLLAGTPLTYSIEGTDKSILGFRHEGNLTDAILALKARGPYDVFLTPGGVLIFTDVDNPPDAPFNFIVGIRGFNNLRKRISSQRPVTQVTIKGGVTRHTALDPEEEDIEETFKGNGTQKTWNYNRLADQIALTYDGVPTDIVPEFETGWEDAFVINRRRAYQLAFKDPVPDGIEFTIAVKIRRARAVVNDTARQADLAAKFPGFTGIFNYTEEIESLHTDGECLDAARAKMALLKEFVFDVSGTQIDEAEIAYPGEQMIIGDYRDAFYQQLRIKSNNLEWSNEFGWFMQSVSMGKGGNRSAQALTAGSGSQEVTPPTETPASGEFTITMEPDGIDTVPYVAAYYSDGVYYTPDQVEAFQYWELTWETVSVTAGEEIVIAFTAVGNFTGVIMFTVDEDLTADDTTVTSDITFGYIGDTWTVTFSKDPGSPNPDLFAVVRWFDSLQYFTIHATTTDGADYGEGGGGGSGGT